jgi:hypothetical protein
MSLSQDKLRDEIRKFQDPDYSQFDAFPSSPSDAAEKWASAFNTYIQDMEVISPSSVTPTTSSATFSSVKSAFKNPLTFTVSMTADEDEATELAGAWAAGVNAITLAPGATYGAGTITVIDPLSTVVSSTKPTLKQNLKNLFDNQSLNAMQRAGELASAFHSATTAAGVTTCTYVISSTPPVTNAAQPLSFG